MRSVQRLFDSVFGLGILQPLMDDPRVEEIIVNGPLRIFTIRDGHKEQVHGVYFDNDDELRQLVKRVVSGAGRRLDEAVAHGRRPPARRLTTERGDPAREDAVDVGHHPQIRAARTFARRAGGVGRAQPAPRPSFWMRPSRLASTSW